MIKVHGPEKIEQKTIYIEYICSKCGAKDVLKNGPNEVVPPAANCWNCRAGRELPTTNDMLEHKIGMFPKRKINPDEYQSNFEKTRNKVTYISDLKKEEESSKH